MCGDCCTKTREKEKWLGDWFHASGLAGSVEETIKQREPKIKAAIFEVVGLIEDFNLQALGGIKCAVEIWEASIIPSLLNNSETWTKCDKNCLKRLNDLQLLFCWTLLQVPVGTPWPSLLSELGLCGMEQRVM